MDKITVELNNKYALIKAEKSILEQIYVDFAFLMDGYEKTHKYLAGQWNGYIYPISKKGKFAAGLYKEYCDRLVEKYDVTLRDKQEVNYTLLTHVLERLNTYENEQVGKYKLYPLQFEALISIFYCYDDVVPILRHTIKMDTGGGKSVIMAFLLNAFKGTKCLVMCHSKVILVALQKLFKEFDLDAGFMVENMIYLTTDKSYFKKMSDKDKYDLVVVDECHRVSGPQFTKILETINYEYIVGLSATPHDINDTHTWQVKKLLGSVSCDILHKDLRQEGIVSDISVSIYECSYFAFVMSNRESREMAFYSHPTKINVAIEKQKKYGKILMACESNMHIQMLKSAILKKQPQARIEIYNGELSTNERLKVIEKYEKNQVDYLIMSGAGKEGLNIKNIYCIIYLRGGESVVWLKQFRGRGTRLKEDENELDFVDFRDNHKSFLPAYNKRKELYDKEGLKINFNF